MIAGKIYCIGEGIESGNMIINMHNLEENSGKKAEFISTRWEAIKAKFEGVNIENRQNAQMVFLPDGRMLLSGGHNSNKNTSIVGQTMYMMQKGMSGRNIRIIWKIQMETDKCSCYNIPLL